MYRPARLYGVDGLLNRHESIVFPIMQIVMTNVTIVIVDPDLLQFAGQFTGR